MNPDNIKNEKVCAKGSCESCMMPFAKDTGVRENEKYCSLCFKDGKLCYEGNDLKEFQRIAKDSMIKRGINPIKAWFFTKMIAYAPRWKNK
ncbi:MAG: zinc ribbon domain-containing protein [Nitrospira sp.]